MKWHTIPAIFLFALLISACSGKEKTSHPHKHIVMIKAMQFQPAQLKVLKGDTVEFINQDMLVHNVTERKTKAWASDSLSSGDAYSMIVKESVEYFCSLHPVMRGKILVE